MLVSYVESLTNTISRTLFGTPSTLTGTHPLRKWKFMCINRRLHHCLLAGQGTAGSVPSSWGMAVAGPSGHSSQLLSQGPFSFKQGQDSA